MEGLGLRNPSQGGAALTRTLSSSHVTPRTMSQYQDFFSLKARKEVGTLDVKLNSKDGWNSQRIVFNDGVLSYGTSEDEPYADHTKIRMDRVISVRTDDSSSNGNMTILVTTTENKIFLRASSKDESVGSPSLSPYTGVSGVTPAARASSGDEFIRLDSNSSRRRPSGSAVGVSVGSKPAEDAVWLSELGHGHGWHSFMVKKRQSFHEAAVGASGDDSAVHPDSQSTEAPGTSASDIGTSSGLRGSIWARSVAERSTNDLTQLSSGETGLGRHDPSRTGLNGSSGLSQLSQSLGRMPGNYMSSSQGTGVAMSPAIPINFARPQVESEAQKVAGSYVDPAKTVLQGRPEGHLDDEDSHEDDESDGRRDSDDDDDDDGLMFDMDDGRPRAPSPVPTQAKGRSSITGKGSPTGELRNSFSGRGSFGGSFAGSFGGSFGGGEWAGPNSPRPLRWTTGHCTRLGPRNANEDRFSCIPNLAKAMAVSSPTASANGATQSGAVRQGFFAVYDGHCGDQASSFLQTELHAAIYGHSDYHLNLEKAISETCRLVDTSFLARCASQRLYCGTTALGAFIIGSRLVVFNIGDCQAVICCDGVPVNMTEPHKPGRPDEEARIKLANGWVTEEKELYMGRLHRMDLTDSLVRDMAQQVNWVTIHRVCGELAVSRSIGDPDYKGFTPGAPVSAFFAWPDGHDQVFHADLVIPDPEIQSRDIGPGDEFLLIASDGLWDVVTPRDAVKFVKAALLDSKSASEAAEDLCDLALKLGSSDNVTLVIVQFIHS